MFQRHHGFASYWEFEAFEAALTQQLSSGQAVAVSAAAMLAAAPPYQARAYYRLPGSAQVWALSLPANAWWGYFLPLEEAQTYQRELLQRDQRRRWGYLLVLAIGVAVFLWVRVGRLLGSPPTSP